MIETLKIISTSAQCFLIILSTQFNSYRVEYSINNVEWRVLEADWNTMIYGNVFGGYDISTNGMGFFRAVPID